MVILRDVRVEHNFVGWVQNLGWTREFLVDGHNHGFYCRFEGGVVVCQGGQQAFNLGRLRDFDSLLGGPNLFFERSKEADG